MMGKHLIVLGHGYDDRNRLDPGAHGNGTNEHEFLNEEFYPLLKKYAPSNVDFYTTKNMFARRDAQRVSGYDSVTELHLDWAPGASGGHIIIYKDYDPDDVDIAIRDIVKKHVGLRMSSGVSRRDNLLNLNTFANRGITYRLVELGFINNSGDMAKIRKNMHAYARDLLEAITGKEIKGDYSSSVEPKILKYRDSGSGVERLQKRLIEAGYELPKYGADGDYGDETVRAVREFQKDHGLPINSFVDHKVQAKLKEVIEMADRPFKDVKKEAWYYEDIEEAKDVGIAKGLPDGSYEPDKSITKAEATSLALRAYNKALEDAIKYFKDNK